MYSGTTINTCMHQHAFVKKNSYCYICRQCFLEIINIYNVNPFVCGDFFNNNYKIEKLWKKGRYVQYQYL